MARHHGNGMEAQCDGYGARAMQSRLTHSDVHMAKEMIQSELFEFHQALFAYSIAVLWLLVALMMLQLYYRALAARKLYSVVADAISRSFRWDEHRLLACNIPSRSQIQALV